MATHALSEDTNDAELRESAAGIDPALVASLMKRIDVIELATKNQNTEKDKKTNITLVCSVVLAVVAIIGLPIAFMESMKSDLRYEMMKLHDDNKNLENLLNQRITQVKTELSTEIAEVKTELSAEIAKVETELSAEIRESEKRLTDRIVALENK